MIRSQDWDNNHHDHHQMKTHCNITHSCTDFSGYIAIQQSLVNLVTLQYREVSQCLNVQEIKHQTFIDWQLSIIQSERWPRMYWNLGSPVDPSNEILFCRHKLRSGHRQLVRRQLVRRQLVTFQNGENCISFFQSQINWLILQSKENILNLNTSLKVTHNLTFLR